jgi:peptide/nickel transport system permease protein
VRKVLKNYFLVRTLKALISILIVTTLTFFLIRLMPGNPIDIYVSQQTAQGIPYQEAQQMAASMFQIDLDRPVYLQYADYLAGLAHGNFGMSISTPGTPVSKLILKFLPYTLFVCTISIIASFTLGIAFGTLMAYKRNSWIDHVLSTFASIISAIPSYVTAVLIIVWFGIQLKVFDLTNIRGSLSPGMKPGFRPDFFIDALYHASLPITTFILVTIGSWMLSMKANTVSTLGEDYVLVARARGLSDGRIASAYVGRNAVLPLFTQLAISIANVVGGSVFIEFIFVYNGIGLKLQQAITARDYPVMQAIFVILCASVVFANFAADLVYGWLDPRIRIQGR